MSILNDWPPTIKETTNYCTVFEQEAKVERCLYCGEVINDKEKVIVEVIVFAYYEENSVSYWHIGCWGKE